MFRNPYADGLIVLVILLLFFGPKRLPTLGRSLGSGLREFKDSITGHGGDEDERPELTQQAAQSASTHTPAPPAGAASSAPAGASAGAVEPAAPARSEQV